jgi:hypothetical protein
VVFVVVLAGAAIGIAGVAMTSTPLQIRLIVALLIGLTLTLIAIGQPRTAIVVTLSFLVVLTLVRRLLIPVAGWAQTDPLVLMGPLVSIILIHRLFMMEKRPIARDGLSKLVIALLAIAVLESINPLGGSLFAGLTGLLFLPAPIIWFFVGRELVDRRMMNILLGGIGMAGVGIAAYGLPSWDAAWVTLGGYTALNVNGSIRAFGTFSSAAEYAYFLGITLVVAFAAVLHRKWIAMLGLPILGYALFIESSRGIVLVVLATAAIMLGMRTGSVRWAIFTVLASAAGLLGMASFLGPQLTAAADRSGNPFLVHEVGGLLNPFDPGQSTLLAHQSMVVNGLVSGLQHPLGFGLAAINPSAARFNNLVASGTESDLSNAFVSLGLLGGLLFAAALVMILWRGFRLGVSTGDITSLAALAIILVTFGQWLNGGYYAAAPIAWLVMGWVSASWMRKRVESRAEKPDHRRLPAGAMTRSSLL